MLTLKLEGYEKAKVALATFSSERSATGGWLFASNPCSSPELLAGAYALARALAIIEDRRNKATEAGLNLDDGAVAVDQLRRRLVGLAKSEKNLKEAAKTMSAESRRIGKTTREALNHLDNLTDQIRPPRTQNSAASATLLPPPGSGSGNFSRSAVLSARTRLLYSHLTESWPLGCREVPAVAAGCPKDD